MGSVQIVLHLKKFMAKRIDFDKLLWYSKRRLRKRTLTGVYVYSPVTRTPLIKYTKRRNTAMMKAYAGPSGRRGGGNSTRSGRGGNVLQRAGRAVRNGIQNVVNRVRGR